MLSPLFRRSRAQWRSAQIRRSLPLQKHFFWLFFAANCETICNQTNSLHSVPLSKYFIIWILQLLTPSAAIYLVACYFGWHVFTLHWPRSNFNYKQRNTTIKKKSSECHSYFFGWFWPQFTCSIFLLSTKPPSLFSNIVRRFIFCVCVSIFPLYRTQED